MKITEPHILKGEVENLGNLVETPRRAAVMEHFLNRFINDQPPEQIGGVRETTGNYLQYFLTPEVADVFCTKTSTFDFSEIDKGKIILVTMPQKFQTERRYVNTFLKLLFYNHALRRFDKSKAERANDNLLILWDEAQRFMTASEDGTSDYNCVDVIREAGATIVAAAQSTTSLVPPLGNDKSKVLTLNLRNRMIFRSADEADAVQAADFLGKKLVVKRSWGSSAGKRSVNFSETEEHKIKSYKLRKLRDHECVLVHCERGFRQVTLPPMEADGTVSKWFPWWRKLF
jgi:type IV secretory pathway TraG/TraD family ATPase VirD4